MSLVIKGIISKYFWRLSQSQGWPVTYSKVFQAGVALNKIY